MPSAPEPPPGRKDARQPKILVAVFVGGMVGTALRLALDTIVVDAVWMREFVPIPAATVLVNLVGSGVLGLLVGAGWTGTRAWLRPAVTSGLLGSFTTFSALIAATLPVSFDPSVGGVAGWGFASLLLVGSVAAGLMVAAAGMRVGRRIAHHSARAHKAATGPADTTATGAAGTTAIDPTDTTASGPGDATDTAATDTAEVSGPADVTDPAEATSPADAAATSPTGTAASGPASSTPPQNPNKRSGPGGMR